MDERTDVLNRPLVDDVDLGCLPPKTSPPCVVVADRSGREDDHERATEKRMYTEGKLNAEQRQIYRYMFDHPAATILIQAGPGTGKTFTMLTLAHAWKQPVNVVIHKHDLLYTFRHCANRFTVARFCMTVWRLSFPSFVALERQLSGRMSANHFVNAIVGLLRTARLPNLGDSIVILDEYTVIPKPILFALLVLLKHHRVGTVICGDKNQLQNIHNSVHAQRCSSHDIATAFTDRSFALTKNERCGDAGYNDLVDYVSRFSSDRPMDKFGFALAAAIFNRKFMTNSSITDTHLASHHRDISRTVHMMVINTGVPVSFYFINASGVQDVSRVQGERQQNGLYLPTVTLAYLKNAAPEKYLPYLPLIVGCRYFVHTHSEYSQATLERVDESTDTVFLRRDDGETTVVRKANCNAVVFEKHRQYLLNGGDEDGYGGVGQLFNYPIYMANTMSIHMCQGRTIRNSVDLFLNDSTYQGFYVSVSRVTNPEQITRVIVPDIPAHLVSTLINFPQLCSRPALTVDELDACLGGNYMHYPVRDAELMLRSMHLVGRFFASQNVDERRRIRDQLCCEFTEVNPVVLRCSSTAQQKVACVEKNGTMTLILRYKYVMLALSLLNDRDSYVWIHEFMKLDPLVTLLLFDRRTDIANGPTDERFELLRRVCGVDDRGYRPNEDTLQYVVRTAKWNSKADADVKQWYIEENRTNDTVLETSRFRCAVYKRITAKLPITVVWLFDQLRLLVSELPDRLSVETNDAAVKRKPTPSPTFMTMRQLVERSVPRHGESECTPFKLRRFTRRQQKKINPTHVL